MLRVCAQCGSAKSETEFYSVTQRGITRLRRVCKECSKAQLRDHSADDKPAGRVCTQCRTYKPLTEFHKHKICRYGVEPMCKECRLEKRRAYGRKYPERVRNTDLMMRYGMTLGHFHAILARQQGKCAICGTSDEKLVVDHNHVTGQVRSLLCSRCNTMVGYAREDPAILLAGAAYLREHEHEHEVAAGEVTAASARRKVGDGR